MAKQWLPPAKIPVTVGRSESGEDGLDRQGPRGETFIGVNKGLRGVG